MLNARAGHLSFLLVARALAHLKQSCVALAEKQYFASAVWAAVLLEAILDDFAQLVGLPKPGQDDLNSRIQQIQQFSKSRTDTSFAVPDEIVKRFGEIRNTRNRLVHDTGLEKSTLAQDADFMHAGLQVVLDWFKSVQRPVTESQPVAPNPGLSGGVPTFLSTIRPHSVAQQYFLDDFKQRLLAIGITPVVFEPSIYDKNDPVGTVRDVIKSCRGLIALGLERTHAYFLRDKEGTDAQKEFTHRQYTSGWLHLEAGIAIALGLDVFVLCQTSVHGDGIFDRQWNTYPVAEIAALDSKSPAIDGFLLHLEKWAARISATT